MESLSFFYHYIGPALFALLPISILCWVLLFYVLYSVITSQDINPWVELLLAHSKEAATLIGLLGSVYALTSSFQVDGKSVEEIRNTMFITLSTGFWSTIAGVLVSIEASIGLLLMKRI